MDTAAYRTVPRGDDVVLLWRDPEAEVDVEVHRWTETGCAGAPGPSLSALLAEATRHAHARRDSPRRRGCKPEEVAASPAGMAHVCLYPGRCDFHDGRPPVLVSGFGR